MLVALTVGLAAKKRGIFLRTALFAAAISLQLYDLGNGLVAHTWAKNVARQEKRYVSPYETAVPHIGGARRLCFTVSDADFCDTGYFALKHGLAADDYYFARDIRRSPDPSGMRKLLDDGKADGDCVYLLLPEERELVEKRFPELKSRILATPGRSVLAPNAIGVTPSDGGCR